MSAGLVNTVTLV